MYLDDINKHKEYSNLEDEAQSKFTNRLLDDIKEYLGRCE